MQPPKPNRPAYWPPHSQTVSARVRDWANQNFFVALFGLVVTVVFGSTTIAFALVPLLMKYTLDGKDLDLKVAESEKAALKAKNTALQTDVQHYIDVIGAVATRNIELRNDSSLTHAALDSVAVQLAQARSATTTIVNAAVGEEKAKYSKQVAAIQARAAWQVSILQKDMSAKMAIVRDSLRYSQAERKQAQVRADAAEKLVAWYVEQDKKDKAGQDALKKAQALRIDALQRKGGIFGSFLYSKEIRAQKLGLALNWYRQAEDYGMLASGFTDQMEAELREYQ